MDIGRSFTQASRLQGHVCVGRNSHFGEKGGGTSTDSFLLKNIRWLVLLVWSTVLQSENKYNDDFLDTEGI